MTCKDCIHFNVCDSGRHIGEHIEDDGVYSEGVERDCAAFERKQSEGEWIEKIGYYTRCSICETNVDAFICGYEY